MRGQDYGSSYHQHVLSSNQESAKEHSPKQLSVQNNALGGLLRLGNQFVYGAEGGDRIVSFSHQLHKKNGQKAIDSDIYNPNLIFGNSVRNTQAFAVVKEEGGASGLAPGGASSANPLSDGAQEELKESQHDFDYADDSMIDERPLNSSQITLHLIERVNTIPEEDVAVVLHQGLRFSKNSGGLSRHPDHMSTTQIMYETARTSGIEEGQTNIRDNPSYIYKNLLNIQQPNRHSRDRSKSPSIEPLNENVMVGGLGARGILNVRFGTIGLGNNSLYDTSANRNKGNPVNVDLLYLDLPIYDNNEEGVIIPDLEVPIYGNRRRKPQDIKSSHSNNNQLKRGHIPSPHYINGPHHQRNIFEQSNYNQKQSALKFQQLRMPTAQIGATGNIEGPQNPLTHHYHQSSSFAFINNNIQLEQTLEKYSDEIIQRQNNLEESKTVPANNQNGSVDYQVSNPQVYTFKPKQNGSVKEVDLMVDGSHLYESESEIKRMKRSPYPMGLQAVYKDIPAESMECPLMVSQSQYKSGVISQLMMTSKLTSNNTLLQQALLYSNNHQNVPSQQFIQHQQQPFTEDNISQMLHAPNIKNQTSL